MVWRNIIIGGAGLSLGSSLIEGLPSSAAKTNVQSGLASAGSFFPVMGTIGGAGLAMNQLKNLRSLE